MIEYSSSKTGQVTLTKMVATSSDNIVSQTMTEQDEITKSYQNILEKEIVLECSSPMVGADNSGFSLNSDDSNIPVNQDPLVINGISKVKCLDIEQQTIAKQNGKKIRFSIHDNLDYPKESKFIKQLNRVVLVVCAFCTIYLSMGISFCIGTFLPAWLEEFGDSRAKTAAIQSTLIGVAMGSGIIVGVLIDRFGVKLAMRCGAVLGTCGFLGGVYSPSTTVLMISIGVIGGFGSSLLQLGTIVTVSLTLKNSVPFALAILMTGAGVGGATMPWIFSFFIDTYGWRGAMYLVAGMELQCLVFSNVLLVCSKQVVGGSRTKNTDKLGLKKKLSLICKTRFILVSLATFTGGGAMNGFVLIMMDWGNANNLDGVFYLFLMSLISSVARPVAGALSMLRFANTSAIIGVAVSAGGATVVCLSFVKSYSLVILLVCLFGVFYGALMAINSGAIRDLVGQEPFSLALGIASTFNGSASFIYGILYGFMFDMTKSYSLPLQTFGSLAVVCGLLPVLHVVKQKFFG